AHEVLLFTDLANPTSNGVYQQLGFEPVGDRVALLFASAPAPGS
ncbi:GNAT family N-acetyltransferase, partial [Frankia sp. CcWB2]